MGQTLSHAVMKTWHWHSCPTSSFWRKDWTNWEKSRSSWSINVPKISLIEEILGGLGWSKDRFPSASQKQFHIWPLRLASNGFYKVMPGCNNSTVSAFLMSNPRVAAAAMAHVVAKGAPITTAQGQAVSRITKPRWIHSWKFWRVAQGTMVHTISTSGIKMQQLKWVETTTKSKPNAENIISITIW